MLRRLLIIDDSDEVRDLVKYCTARSWPNAEIELYHPNKGMPGSDFGWQDYDMVILDYQLGLSNEDGLDWLKSISRYPGIAPILFMTAYSSIDNAVKAIKLGAANYLKILPIHKKSSHTNRKHYFSHLILKCQQMLR
jgi:DNA-binding NtrC family response regulator